MLKSLELFGFKSFADRTRFEFADGITGVVGPNGSGKSNVVDSIKWILGDQSPKSLRGKEMTDVIFNGAAGRKPMAFAEAFLTFDNSAGLLPVDHQEVHVGRRLYRSGDSEYLINRQAARLKDIKELFMGTGAATSAYSIIEQGRVDQILQSNASARRVVFDEAAGISRYKARKAEALRKLERVSQNLLRLTDIVDEVEARLNSTRTQAAKAVKYRQTSDLLRELWLGLAADDSRHISSQLETIEAALREKDAQIEELTAQQKELERGLAEFDVRTSEADERIRAAQGRSASCREDIARHEATVRHLAARQQELEAELVRLRKQASTTAARADEGNGELQRTRLQVKAFQREFDRHQKELTDRLQQIQQISARIHESKENLEIERQRQLDTIQQITEWKHRLEGFHSQSETLDNNNAAATARIEQLQDSVAVCESDYQLIEQQLAQAGEELQRSDDDAKQIRDRQNSMLAEHDGFRRRLAEQRELRSACKARIGLLEELERRQQGVGIGVKEILHRARSARSAPWNEVLGSVADLLQVDLEQAALLEVALGERAQLIVVQSIEPLLDYLRQGATRITGRVGFIDTLAVDPSVKSGGDLNGLPGVVGRADSMVTPSAKAPHLAERLLQETWVVDALETAIELAKGPGQACRFVTLQGELLEADRTVSVGTIRSDAALVSRKSELRKLKSDLLKLDSRISGEEDQLSQLGRSLSQFENELDSVEAAKRQQADRVASLKSEVNLRRQEQDRLQKELRSVNEDILRHDAQQEELTRAIAESQMQLARMQEDSQEMQDQIAESQRQVARIEHRRGMLDKKQTEEKLKLAKREERLEGLRSACSRLETETRQRNDQLSEARRRLEAGLSKRRRTTLNSLNANAALAELFLIDEANQESLVGLMAEKDQLRAERARLNQTDSQLRAQRRELGERRHQAEIQARDLRHQMESLQQRIEEEYQLDLPDVVASNASAFRDYLNEVGARSPEVESSDSTSDESQSNDAASDRQSDREVDEGSITFPEVRDQIETRVNRLRRKLKLMGNVNTDSLRDLDDLEGRYRHLSDQLQDLEEAKATLEEIVRRINSESRRLFIESFEAITTHFRQLFRKLFGGGEGDIILEDPNDILECGIDIVARPPGKELRSITLLSGGEKTLTAVALLMSILKSRPSPFCILDEVDAALDEANIERYMSVLKEFEETTQFIMITHSKRSMSVADVIYGVTMEQSGVSKKMSVRFEDVGPQGEFRTPSANESADPPSELGDAA